MGKRWEYANYQATRPEARDGRFFVGTNGSNLDRAHVYNVVRRYLKLAGINKGKRGPHILRHTFCTRLHQKGVGPFTIKDLAGHKSLSTTMRYVNIENKEQAEAIDRLEFGATNLSLDKKRLSDEKVETHSRSALLIR